MVKFLDSTFGVEFDKEAGNFYCFTLTKQDIPYGWDIVGIVKVTKPNTADTQCLMYKAQLNHAVCTKSPIETITLANGTLIKVWGLLTIGTSAPDISNYWYATLGDSPKIVSWQGRSSCWRDEDYIYPNWITRLKERFSTVELAIF